MHSTENRLNLMEAKALVFDRDGTLIEHIPYLVSSNQVKLLDTVIDAIKICQALNIYLFLHTNQSAIGRGLCTNEDVIACNERMLQLIGLGNVFEKICIAPEMPGVHSKYRKPSPAFAHEIMREFGLAPSTVYYIGDRASDLETALAAGTRGIGVATGLNDLMYELSETGLEGVFPVCENLLEAVKLAVSGNWQ